MNTFRWRDPSINWKNGKYILPAFVHEPLIEFIERGEIPLDNFLLGVLENDLRRSVHSAEPGQLRALTHLVGWLYNFAPSGCHGSKEKVVKWKQSGGLAGLGIIDAADALQEIGTEKK